MTTSEISEDRWVPKVGDWFMALQQQFGHPEGPIERSGPYRWTAGHQPLAWQTYEKIDRLETIGLTTPLQTEIGRLSAEICRLNGCEECYPEGVPFRLYDRSDVEALIAAADAFADRVAADADKGEYWYDDHLAAVAAALESLGCAATYDVNDGPEDVEPSIMPRLGEATDLPQSVADVREPGPWERIDVTIMRSGAVTAHGHWTMDGSDEPAEFELSSPVSDALLAVFGEASTW